MRKALIAMALIISLLTFSGLGYVIGARDASAHWSGKIAEVAQILKIGTYAMAWTNTRACILAVDSAAMRFVVAPTAEDLSDLKNRYEACESHWELLDKYTPDAQSKSSLTRAHWEFKNWWGQLEAMMSIQVKMVVAQNAGDLETAVGLYDTLIEHRGASRRYRDRIEAKLFEAW